MDKLHSAVREPVFCNRSCVSPVRVEAAIAATFECGGLWCRLCRDGLVRVADRSIRSSTLHADVGISWGVCPVRVAADAFRMRLCESVLHHGLARECEVSISVPELCHRVCSNESARGKCQDGGTSIIESHA